MTATIDDPTGALAIDIAATHDPGLGAGHADLKLFPVTFVPGLRPPDRLFPILHGVVADAAGTVAADTHAAWSRSGLIGGATVLLDGLSALIGPAKVDGVNGVLTFDRLWPPSLPPGQTLSIGLIDVGVPLTDGLVEFWMAPNGRVAGLVGERPDGLVGAVDPGAGADVVTLVADVNAQRMAYYAEVAAGNNSTIEQVQAVAGAELIERTPAGQFVMNAAGRWIQK